MIEARSCERFEILSRKCCDSELSGFYRRLHGAEIRHHNVFLALGREAVSREEGVRRWKEMLGHEARIMKAQAPGPGVLSGIA